MTGDVIEFPSDLVSLADGAFQTLGHSYFRETRPSTPELCGALFQAVFYASLRREEGRFSKIDVAFTGSRVPGGDTCIPFAIMTPCTEATLAKLAPAIETRSTRIGVLELGGELVIWGLVHDGSAKFDLVRGEAFSAAETPALHVSSGEVGHLRVESLFGLIFEFRGGRVQDPPLPVFDEPGLVADRLKRSMPVFEPIAGPNPRAHRQFTYPATLRRLLRLAREHQRGACILLVSAREAVSGLRIETEIPEGATALTRALESMAGEETWKLQRPPVPADSLEVVTRAYRDALAMIAQLTAVDGAVLLGYDLTVLGFGATIQSLEAKSVLRAANLDGTGRTAFAGVGHRHKSAAAFCSANASAAAFVISEDGPISCMVRDGEDVIVFRPISLDLPL